MKHLISKISNSLLFLLLGIAIIFFLNLQEARASNVSYYIYESPNRSAASLVNTSGAVINNYDYDAFGSVLNKTECVTNDFKYVGEQFDSETGLIFLRNRYYDPSLGRFITKDPVLGKITLPQRINPYPYCIDNPVKLIDPLGLEAVFGKRPLENWPFMINDPVDDLLNAEVSHEQVWFREFHYINGVGLTNNVGFGPSGLFTEHPALNPILNPNSKYKISGSSYNEELMVQAINKTSTGRYSLLGDNWLFAFFRASSNKNNCQDWSDRVRNNYPGKIEGSIGGLGVNDLLSLGNNIFIDSAYAMQLSNPVAFGGVSFSKTALLMLNIGDIAGAGYDQGTCQVILYGKRDVSLPGMELDDLAVAVRSVYGYGGKTPQDPGVSIGTEPSDQPGQMKVRYDGQTNNTGFGSVMFESDRLLKCLIMGKDNISGASVSSGVSGYKSMLERYREAGSGSLSGGEASDRMWFVPEEVRLAQSDDAGSMVFEQVKMELLTESKFQDNVYSNPIAEAFASHFTRHYDEFAEERPILKELKRLGKITGVVKWIKDNNIPFDLSYFENYIPETLSTPQYTPETSVSTSWTEGRTVYTLTITGDIL